jgi:hypothetical protein
MQEIEKYLKYKIKYVAIIGGTTPKYSIGDNVYVGNPSKVARIHGIGKSYSSSKKIIQEYIVKFKGESSDSVVKEDEIEAIKYRFEPGTSFKYVTYDDDLKEIITIGYVRGTKRDYLPSLVYLVYFPRAIDGEIIDTLYEEKMIPLEKELLPRETRVSTLCNFDKTTRKTIIGTEPKTGKVSSFTSIKGGIAYYSVLLDTDDPIDDRFITCPETQLVKVS